MNLNIKLEQFKKLITKLKLEVVTYTIDLAYEVRVEFHGHYEDLHGDHIEGISERFLSDDGKIYVDVNWKYINRTVYVSMIEYDEEEEDYPEESICMWELDFELDEFVEFFYLEFTQEVKLFIEEQLQLQTV